MFWIAWPLVFRLNVVLIQRARYLYDFWIHQHKCTERRRLTRDVQLQLVPLYEHVTSCDDCNAPIKGSTTHVKAGCIVTLGHPRVNVDLPLATLPYRSEG